MTLFWIICALLLVVAALFIALPLWRSKVNDKQVLPEVANLGVFRDQVAEMETDLHDGLLTPELYEQGKRELETRLLDEVKGTGAAAKPLPRNPHKVLALTLVALLPMLTLGLYWKLGSPDALLQAQQPQMAHTSGENGQGAMEIGAAVQELESKVAQNPMDADGLYLLGRSYAETERYADAAKIFKQLTTMLPKEGQLWVEYAYVLTMLNRGEMAGQPIEMINKALKLDPQNPRALAMAGTGAMMTGEYPTAVRHWQTLLKVLPPNSEESAMVAKGIQEAQRRMDGGAPVAMQEAAPAAPQQAAVAAGQERISGSVSLSAGLQGKAKPDDFVFVLARAVEGPKMPLAVMRKQVKDLPLQFTLDDSMAMTPQMKLSKFDKVVVVARISASGGPIAQAGDLEVVSEPMKPGSSGVKLSIDSVVK